MEWRRGECKLGIRECAGESKERERALRQRHVGDVVWLPQAEERGGVGECWKSAESVRVRERDEAGGEEARNKSRKAWIKGRGRGITESSNSKQQKKSVRKEGTRRDQTTDDFRATVW